MLRLCAVVVVVVLVSGAAESPPCSSLAALRRRLDAVDRAFDPTLAPRDDAPAAFEVGYDARGKAAWAEAVAAFLSLRREAADSSHCCEGRGAGDGARGTLRRHAAELALAEERLEEVGGEVALLRALAAALREQQGRAAALARRRAELGGRLAGAARRQQQRQQRGGRRRQG